MPLWCPDNTRLRASDSEVQLTSRVSMRQPREIVCNLSYGTSVQKRPLSTKGKGVSALSDLRCRLTLRALRPLFVRSGTMVAGIICIHTRICMYMYDTMEYTCIVNRRHLKVCLPTRVLRHVRRSSKPSQASPYSLLRPIHGEGGRTRHPRSRRRINASRRYTGRAHIPPDGRSTPRPSPYSPPTPCASQ